MFVALMFLCFINVMCILVGYINEDRLRELLTSMGDRFTDDEVSL